MSRYKASSKTHCQTILAQTKYTISFHTHWSNVTTVENKSNHSCTRTGKQSFKIPIAMEKSTAYSQGLLIAQHAVQSAAPTYCAPLETIISSLFELLFPLLCSENTSLITSALSVKHIKWLQMLVYILSQQYYSHLSQFTYQFFTEQLAKTMTQELPSSDLIPLDCCINAYISAYGL